MTVLAWGLGLVMFSPILWMILTSFKTELDAFSNPLNLLSVHWTIDNYLQVRERSDYLGFALNSVLLSVGSTIAGLLIGSPAAWAMAFQLGKRTKYLLLFILSTKMMPGVGVLIPVYLLLRDAGLLDAHLGLGLVLFMINLPVIIWLLYSYFKEIPPEILELSRIDGLSPWREFVYVVVPLAIPGTTATLLLGIILAWNESFWTLNLTSSSAAPLTVFIASYSKPEGLFWAKLSAASILATAPILILGWFSQRQLVRGLTFGALD